MLKVLSKIALSIGAILGIHFLEINKEKPTLIRRPPEAKLSRATKVESIDDIELFEKMNKCSFEFTENFEKKEFYKAKEFLEKVSTNNYDGERGSWEKAILARINTKKWSCADKKRVVFSWESEKKRFKPQEDLSIW